jgi:hypothetical protein
MGDAGLIRFVSLMFAENIIIDDAAARQTRRM